MNKYPLPIVAVFTGFLGVVGLALANSEGPVLDPVLAKGGWEEIRFDDKTPNAFRSCGKTCIKVETRDSVSMIAKSFPVKLKDMPVLTWEWMIDGPPPQSDLFVKGEDDRAIALYVTFPYDANRASLAEKLFRPFVEIFNGADTPGRVISYVWGGKGQRGDVQESPYLGAAGALMIVRNGDDRVGAWVMERVNVAEDHRKIFGDVPSTVSHVLISSDSDDVGVSGTATVRRISFEAASALKR
jgi:hypothetical protein